MPRVLPLVLALLLWPTAASAGASTWRTPASPDGAIERAIDVRLPLDVLDLVRAIESGLPDLTPRAGDARPTPAPAGFRLALLIGCRLHESPDAVAHARVRRVPLPYDATPPPPSRARPGRLRS